MKNTLYFLAGVIVTLIIFVAGATYFLDTKLVRGNSEDLIISDQAVEQALETKKIEHMSVERYDSLSSTFSNKTLITFWASWCGSCLKEIPKLQSYTKKNGLELVYVNFDKQNTGQLKVVLDKMEKLNINKTYQLSGNKKLMDPMNHRMLETFLKDRNINLYTTGLPVNIIYEKGVPKDYFGPIDIEELYISELDKHFES